MPEQTTTVTADMVLEVSPVRRHRAERIAAYATQRLNGLRILDACREVGIHESTGRAFDKVLPALCRHHHLPEPPEYRPPEYLTDFPAATGSRWPAR